jgi:hypothetical protein
VEEIATEKSGNTHKLPTPILKRRNSKKQKELVKEMTNSALKDFTPHTATYSLLLLLLNNWSFVYGLARSSARSFTGIANFISPFENN